jgi:hypothetical protein
MQIISIFGDIHFTKIIFLKIKTAFFGNLYNIIFKKEKFRPTGQN